MFIEPTPTPYDWRFQLFGFPVRVSIWFWLAACVLGYDLATFMPRYLGGVDGPAFQPAVGVGLWIAAVFLSILVHELGHAFAMRYYGAEASIVLYHFGGLAIPESSSPWGRSTSRFTPQAQIVISAAGPAAQLALAAVVYLSLYLTHHDAATWSILDYVLPPSQGEWLNSRALQAAAIFIMSPSINWALLNLLPVYPLDGGQIARYALVLRAPWEGVRYSLMLSVGTAGLIAVWGLSRGQPFLGMMFLMLAVGSWQQLNSMGGGRRPW